MVHSGWERLYEVPHTFLGWLIRPFWSSCLQAEFWRSLPGLFPLHGRSRNAHDVQADVMELP